MGLVVDRAEGQQVGAGVEAQRVALDQALAPVRLADGAVERRQGGERAQHARARRVMAGLPGLCRGGGGAAVVLVDHAQHEEPDERRSEGDPEAAAEAAGQLEPEQAAIGQRRGDEADHQDHRQEPVAGVPRCRGALADQAPDVGEASGDGAERGDRRSQAAERAAGLVRRRAAGRRRRVGRVVGRDVRRGARRHGSAERRAQPDPLIRRAATGAARRSPTPASASTPSTSAPSAPGRPSRSRRACGRCSRAARRGSSSGSSWASLATCAMHRRVGVEVGAGDRLGRLQRHRLLDDPRLVAREVLADAEVARAARHVERRDARSRRASSRQL